LSRADLTHRSFAKDLGQHVVISHVDGRTRPGREPGIDEIAQRLVVVAQDADGDLEELIAVFSVADHRRDLPGWNVGIGQETVGQEAHRPSTGNAAQHAASLMPYLRFVIDKLTDLDGLGPVRAAR